MNAPKASVVVLTHNAGPEFAVLLEKLRGQKTDFGYEILVIDSGSTDGTVELARRFGTTLHRIDPASFDHGATRNLGASFARGEYVAFIVQDAVPLDERWLAAMVENLERDGRVAGVYGRQIPRADAGPLTRVLVNSWATAATERREQRAEDYPKLPPEERRRLATFDNVSSCVRRSVWEGIPFDRTRFAEDLRWGKKVVEAGHTLVYEPRAAVYHSHERGMLYDLRRHYVDGQVLLDLFGLRLTPNLPTLVINTLRSSAFLFRRLRRDEKASGGMLRHAGLAVGHALCSQAGAYLGVKNRRLARAAPRLSGVLDRFLSRGI